MDSHEKAAPLGGETELGPGITGTGHDGYGVTGLPRLSVPTTGFISGSLADFDHLVLTCPPGPVGTMRELRVKMDGRMVLDGEVVTDERAGRAFVAWAKSMAPGSGTEARAPGRGPGPITVEMSPTWVPDVVLQGVSGAGIGVRGVGGQGVEVMRCDGDAGEGMVYIGTMTEIVGMMPSSPSAGPNVFMGRREPLPAVEVDRG